jgi:membrane-bound lytic murein transglycosylase D
MAIIGRDPDQYGFKVDPQPALEIERVGLEKATDLRVIAENLEVPVDLLKDLNPHVLRWTTPPDDSEFELIVPKGYTDRFIEKVVAMPDNERIIWRYHNVKKGETLSVIAKRYGVAVNDLTQANRISTRTSLRIGQELLIPMSGSTRPPASSAPAVASKSASATKTAAASLPASYKVKRGDTLTSIAAKFNLTVNDLKKWNKLTSSRLDIGQKLALAPPNVRQAN